MCVKRLHCADAWTRWTQTRMSDLVEARSLRVGRLEGDRVIFRIEAT